MDTIQQPPQPPRVPLPAGGIQVNFCKNPPCKNFGKPASPDPQPKGRGAKTKKGRDTYSVVGGSAGTSKASYLVCDLCKEEPTMKSNLGIYEELTRFQAYLQDKILSCPNPECPNHGVDVNAPCSNGHRAYFRYGHTATGSQRYKCALCSTTFSAGPEPGSRQLRPEATERIFKHLVSKGPFRRICYVSDVQPQVLYDKINIIHKKCLAFAAEREKRLPAMKLKRLYLSSDRQYYMINWNVRKDKRNVTLYSVGTADLTSRYVFGVHVNYDPDADNVKTEEDAKLINDFGQKPAFRRYARLWLQKEYDERSVPKDQVPEKDPELPLEDGIRETYAEVVARDDCEDFEEVTTGIRLPLKGMQVHSDYTMYGHFFFLRKLFDGVEKVRFYLDQDSGIRAACLSAFEDRIKQFRCDAFYVRVTKKMEMELRRDAMNSSRRRFREEAKRRPELEKRDIKLLLLKKNMAGAEKIGKWDDLWVTHPFPKIDEPKLMISYLTDVHHYGDDHKAWLFNRASLHATDTFFQLVRRFLQPLERPVTSGRKKGKKWHGYSPYDPGMVQKVLDILRVFYNYVKVQEIPDFTDEAELKKRREKMKKKETVAEVAAGLGIDKEAVAEAAAKTGKKKRRTLEHWPLRTPAMMLGIEKAPVTIKDILM